MCTCLKISNGYNKYKKLTVIFQPKTVKTEERKKKTKKNRKHNITKYQKK